MPSFGGTERRRKRPWEERTPEPCSHQRRGGENAPALDQVGWWGGDDCESCRQGGECWAGCLSIPCCGPGGGCLSIPPPGRGDACLLPPQRKTPPAATAFKSQYEMFFLLLCNLQSFISHRYVSGQFLSLWLPL